MSGGVPSWPLLVGRYCCGESSIEISMRDGSHITLAAGSAWRIDSNGEGLSANLVMGSISSPSISISSQDSSTQGSGVLGDQVQFPSVRPREL